jgi:hypothetical protein
MLMLLPLSASAYFLFKARKTYPRDVATAAAAAPSSSTGEPLLAQPT